MNNQRGIGLVQIIWVVAGFLAIATAGWHVVGNMRDASVRFSTPYQAVLLTNGAAYFGHLSGYGGQFPVLTEVYYVVSQTNPETKPGESKQINNVLVKRGRELHEPDRMYLNPTQILFVVDRALMRRLSNQLSHL
jgi:hypothetical protein